MKTILTNEELQQAINKLIQIEPRFQVIYETCPPPEVRHYPQGFEALFKAIISQQISTSVATNIHQRLVQAQLNTAENIAQASDEALRSCGLSRQKIRYLRSLVDHQIDYSQLNTLDNESIIDILTAVTGIGRWTAEIYLLFSLNRADVFAHNDLALQIASQHIFTLSTRPTEKAMRTLAQAWSPQRSASCYLLWAYYRMIKQQDILIN